MKKGIAVLILCCLLSAMTPAAHGAAASAETRLEMGCGLMFFAIADGGQLVAWGTNDFLPGLPREYIPYADRQVVAENVREIYSGTNFDFLYITEDNVLYGLGVGYPGTEPSIFLGKEPDEETGAVRLMEQVEMAAVSMGSIVVLKTDGTVWGWGCDLYGYLGQGSWDADMAWAAEPALLMEDCRFVTGSRSCFLAIRTNGDLYSWTCTAGRDPESVEARYVCSGVESVRAELVLLENGDLCRLLRDGASAEEPGYARVSLSEPIAEGVRQICGYGYITEENDLYRGEYIRDEGWRYVFAMADVEEAVTVGETELLLTLDGTLWERLSSEGSMRLLGNMASLVPEPGRRAREKAKEFREENKWKKPEKPLGAGLVPGEHGLLVRKTDSTY